jgi:hypothetical protein
VFAELTYWAPLIVLGTLAIFKSPIYWGAFGTIYGVWVGILPAIPIQIAFFMLYNKVFSAVKIKIKRKEGDNK